MKKTMIEKIHKIDVLCIIVIIIMAILSLASLSNRYMFIDESIEALIGKNIIKFGYPKVWDGTNLALAGVNGNEFNEDLVPVRNSWLPYYLAAAGQMLSNGFNITNSQVTVGIIRAIFALIGIGGAIALYFLVKEAFRNKYIVLFSLSLYCLSVPVLLYIRSIYYLSPTLTFTITTILFYLKYIATTKKFYLVLFSISSILLYHSFYPYFFIVVLSIVIVFFLFDYSKKLFMTFLVSAGIVASFTIPHYVYIRLFLSKVEHSFIVTPATFAKYLLGYLWQIHAYFFPFIPILLLVSSIIIVKYIIRKKKCNSKLFNKRNNIKETITSAWGNRRKVRSITLVLLIIVINLMVVSLTNSFLDTRRLIASIPFIYILLACFLKYIYENNKLIGIAIVCICLLTNILHVSPYMAIKKGNIAAFEIVVKPPIPYFNADPIWKNKKAELSEYLETSCVFESYMINYLEEIMNDYNDADKGMVDFLNKYSEPGQKVYVLGYQYETVAFYTGLQVVNRLDPEYDPLPTAYKNYPNAEKYMHLTEYPIEQCDWIVVRSNYEKTGLECWYDESKFEEYYIDYPDSEPWNEIWAHSFYTDRSYSGIYIYRNKLTTKQIDYKERS